MPTSVSKLFESVDLKLAGRVSWGQQVRDDQPGVYIVSLSLLPKDEKTSFFEVPPIDRNIVSEWISTVPSLKLDGGRPTPDALVNRLSKFWLSDESILYIGKAGTSLRTRVGQYYRTPLGRPKPHAGGHWLKTVSVLNKLSVFWALTDNPEDIEADLLGRFVQGVSPETKSILHDPLRPFPFANIEFPKGNSKDHGITGSVNRD